MTHRLARKGRLVPTGDRQPPTVAWAAYLLTHLFNYLLETYLRACLLSSEALFPFLLTELACASQI